MNWKRVAKSLVPPFALEVVNRIQQYGGGIRPGYIWQGVYENYKDVPANGSGFDSDVWLESRYRNFERRLAATSNGTQAESVLDEHALLPYLASIVGAKSRCVRILDFGGGLGESYLDVSSALNKCYAIDYHVVET